jgi:hypothetical protein
LISLLSLPPSMLYPYKPSFSKIMVSASTTEHILAVHSIQDSNVRSVKSCDVRSAKSCNVRSAKSCNVRSAKNSDVHVKRRREI